MTRLEELRWRKRWLGLAIVSLVLGVFPLGWWGAVRQPDARTMIAGVLGTSGRTGGSLGLRYFDVARRDDGRFVVKMDGSDEPLPTDATAIGKAVLFRRWNVTGIWVGSIVRERMYIKVADDSSTLDAKELGAVRRLVCEAYRPRANPTELPGLARLETTDLHEARISASGAALDALITLMLGGAFILAVRRVGVGRELERRDRAERGIGLHCPKCGYEARGMPVCPECGGRVREPALTVAGGSANAGSS